VRFDTGKFEYPAPAISRYPELQAQWLPFFFDYLHVRDRFEGTHQMFCSRALHKRYSEYGIGLVAV
jgi:hypothetical protein